MSNEFKTVGMEPLLLIVPIDKSAQIRHCYLPCLQENVAHTSTTYCAYGVSVSKNSPLHYFIKAEHSYPTIFPTKSSAHRIPVVPFTVCPVRSINMLTPAFQGTEFYLYY